MSGALQIWVSGFAAFYAYDAAISLYLAPADLRRPFAVRLFIGSFLSVAFLSVGVTQ
jgi:hypothetical protein